MRNIVIVNVTKIKKNIALIKKFTDFPLILVLKSKCYGMGNGLIKYLQKQGVMIAFNYLEEYFESTHYCELTKPVLILTSTNKICENSLVRYTINSIEDATFFSKSLVPVTVHFQVDTGMNRLGLRDLEQFKEALRIVKGNPLVKIEGLYTHFASNYKEMDYFYLQQKRFKEYFAEYPFEIVHTAATASLGKPIAGNTLRVGLGIYGFYPGFFPLLPSVNVRTKLINIFVAKGQEKLSYDGFHETKPNEIVGIIPLGYYEGFSCERLYYHSANYSDEPVMVVGKIGMNHACVLLPEVNYQSYLTIFPLNSQKALKLVKGNTSFHRYLTGLVAVPKIYLEEYHDLPSTAYHLSKKGLAIKNR